MATNGQHAGDAALLRQIDEHGCVPAESRREVWSAELRARQNADRGPVTRLLSALYWPGRQDTPSELSRPSWRRVIELEGAIGGVVLG